MLRALALVGAAIVLTIPASAVSQTKAQKIANAMSAAPRAVSSKATVMDWPAKEGAPMTTLRSGSNGWTCLPDNPATKGNDPACMDEQWMSFMGALMTKKAPNVSRAGVGYMMAPGGGAYSNTDPYATKPTADNDWGYDPPHIMLLVADRHAMDGMPTTRSQSGGPWVMWPGTQYAHIMVPVSSGKK